MVTDEVPLEEDMDGEGGSSTVWVTQTIPVQGPVVWEVVSMQLISGTLPPIGALLKDPETMRNLIKTHEKAIIEGYIAGLEASAEQAAEDRYYNRD
jgi:hypothetical protein